MSTILVVDDESAVRVLYARALVAQGDLTLDARTAEEALDFLGLNPDVDVVIADLDMPGNGGAWLLEKMQARYPDVAVILSTANEQVPGAVSLQASVVSYLVKPVAMDRLRAAVSDARAWRKRHIPATTNDADPVEAWLDTKLTRPAGDDDTPGR